MKLCIFLVVLLICQASEVDGQDENGTFREMHSISEALAEEISKTQREIQAEEFNPKVEQKATQELAHIKQEYMKQLADLEKKFELLEQNNANVDVDVLTTLAHQYLSDAKQILISTEETLIGEEVDAWWENFGMDMQNKYADESTHLGKYNQPNHDNNEENSSKTKKSKSKGSEVHYMEQKFEGNHGYDEERYARLKEEYAAMQKHQLTESRHQAKMWTDGLPSEDKMKWSDHAIRKQKLNKYTKGIQYETVSSDNAEEIAGVSHDMINAQARPSSENSTSFFHLLFMVCLISGIIGSATYYCLQIENAKYSNVHSAAELTTLLEGKSHYQSCEQDLAA